MYFTKTISKVLTRNLHVGFRRKETTTLPNGYSIWPDHKDIYFLNQHSNPSLLSYYTSFVLMLHRMTLIISIKCLSAIHSAFVY